MDDKELNAMASIIVSGDVPIAARMQLNTEPSPVDAMVRAAFVARESGEYDGMDRAQVVEVLKRNLELAQSGDRSDSDTLPKPQPL